MIRDTILLFFAFEYCIDTGAYTELCIMLFLEYGLHTLDKWDWIHGIGKIEYRYNQAKFY